MAKVTYIGMMGGLAHHNNPSGTTYVFQHGIPHEVKIEDAKHYAEEIRRSGPWIVDMGIIEKTVEVVKKTVKEVTREDKIDDLKELKKRGKQVNK